MPRQARQKSTGAQIIGTYERVDGYAELDGFDEQGEPNYTGSTEIWWDNQETIRDDFTSAPLYVTENLDVIGADEVEFYDEED